MVFQPEPGTFTCLLLLLGNIGQAAELMFHEMGKPCNQGHAEVMKCAHLVTLAKCWWKDQWDGSWIVDHVVGICVMLG